MKYLLIESKSPWDGGGVGAFYELARELGRAGNDVTLFLVQNGVLPARKGCKPAVPELGGVHVLADAFSLRERAIGAQDVAAGIEVVDMDSIVDLLAAGAKAIWH
jgi:sulfur relay (sulfurtransferase) DsrF/TusC family protein